MRFNRWLLLGVLATAGVGATLAVLAWWPTPGVTKANFDRIQVGMTFAEVEATFSAPPGYDVSGIDFKSGRFGRRAQWTDREGFRRALFDFDDRDRVASAFWQHFDERSWSEKLLDEMPWRPSERVVQAERRRAFCIIFAAMN